MPMILSADIGGTKTLVELCQIDQSQHQSIKKEKFVSAKFSQFEAILKKFLSDSPPIDAACFAIAGPVNSTKNYQTAKVTNLPWQLNSHAIGQNFKIGNVTFINDFQAMGYAIEHLSNTDIDVLQTGTPQPHGVRAVIGAGTGLGEAILVYQNANYEVLPSEGGHQDFAVNSTLELELYEYLAKQYAHVSYERILSGQGLLNIFRFLLNKTENINAAQSHQQIMESEDPAASISSAAISQQSPLAVQALSLFMKIYGAQAGNLALTCLPTAGIYVTGGIASKNLAFLKNSEFLISFNNKGRMQNLLESIPVSIVTNTDAGLIGARAFAKKMVKQ